MGIPFNPVTSDATGYPDFTADSTATPTVDDYVALITPWQSTPIKAKFLATIRANLQPYADAQAVISTIPLAYDLDFAEGVQLDAVGEWVGLERIVPAPLPNVFFTFGDPNLGFGKGYWKGPYDSGEGLSVLPDDLYRKFLRAKIVSNSWDGTSEGILAILRTYFTDPMTFIVVDDSAPAVQPIKYFTFGDPNKGFGTGRWKGPGVTGPKTLGYSLKIGFSGKMPSTLDLAVLAARLLPIKAMGSGITYLVSTVDRAPLFGFGPENAAVAGFGRGAWGSDPKVLQSSMNM